MTNKSKDNKWWEDPVKIALIVFGLWFINGILLFQVDDRGSYGDMFGIVNSLFSGLAFAGVIYAILLQRRELQLQREELKLTRNEFKEQNKTLKLQRFENTFFQMLNLHSEIVDQMELSGLTKGRKCFEDFNQKFISQKQSYLNLKLSLDRDEAIALSYETFYETKQAHLGHYFRNLYHILKFVNSSEEEIDKKQYTNLIRAQLSSYELVILFYNGLSKLGKKKFKPLIEKYEFLKNMDFSLLISQDLKKEYEDSAFGENA